MLTSCVCGPFGVRSCIKIKERVGVRLVLDFYQGERAIPTHVLLHARVAGLREPLEDLDRGLGEKLLLWPPDAAARIWASFGLAKSLLAPPLVALCCGCGAPPPCYHHSGGQASTLSSLEGDDRR